MLANLSCKSNVTSVWAGLKYFSVWDFSVKYLTQNGHFLFRRWRNIKNEMLSTELRSLRMLKKCVTCLTFGLTSFKRRADTFERSDIYFKKFKLLKKKKKGGREGEMFVSERAKLSESHRLWLWVKWFPAPADVNMSSKQMRPGNKSCHVPYCLHTVFPVKDDAGGSGLPLLPHWVHLSDFFALHSLRWCFCTALPWGHLSLIISVGAVTLEVLLIQLEPL